MTTIKSISNTSQSKVSNSFVHKDANVDGLADDGAFLKCKTILHDIFYVKINVYAKNAHRMDFH